MEDLKIAVTSIQSVFFSVSQRKGWDDSEKLFYLEAKNDSIYCQNYVKFEAYGRLRYENRVEEFNLEDDGWDVDGIYEPDEVMNEMFIGSVEKIDGSIESRYPRRNKHSPWVLAKSDQFKPCNFDMKIKVCIPGATPFYFDFEGMGDSFDDFRLKYCPPKYKAGETMCPRKKW